MTTLQRLNRQLKAATQLTKQIDQEFQLRGEIEKGFPVELNEAKQHFLDGFAVLNKLEAKIEAAVSHSQESGEAVATLLDNLRDVLTVMGPNGKNLAFLQAANKENLEFFIGFVVQFEEVFQEVLENMPDDDFTKMKEVVDIASGNRN